MSAKTGAAMSLYEAVMSGAVLTGERLITTTVHHHEVHHQAEPTSPAMSDVTRR
jgi:hypothetical protein